jgi:hypothetical protein
MDSGGKLNASPLIKNHNYYYQTRTLLYEVDMHDNYFDLLLLFGFYGGYVLSALYIYQQF